MRGVLAPLPSVLLLLFFQLPPRETDGEGEGEGEEEEEEGEYAAPADASSGLVKAGVPACVPIIEEAARADALEVVRPMPPDWKASPPPLPPPPQRWERSL